MNPGIIALVLVVSLSIAGYIGHIVANAFGLISAAL